MNQANLFWDKYKKEKEKKIEFTTKEKKIQRVTGHLANWSKFEGS